MEDSALLGCYTAKIGSRLPIFWDSLLVPLQGRDFGCLTLEDRYDTLSKKVGNQVPTYAT